MNVEEVLNEIRRALRGSQEPGFKEDHVILVEIDLMVEIEKFLSDYLVKCGNQSNGPSYARDSGNGEWNRWWTAGWTSRSFNTKSPFQEPKPDSVEEWTENTPWPRVLGVRSGASAREIEIAYRRLAMKCHPDRAGGDTRKFQILQAAYRRAQCK